jgi:hypothetical protein
MIKFFVFFFIFLTKMFAHHLKKYNFATKV